MSSNYTRDPSFGNTNKITSRQLTLTGNSGFDPLINAPLPLTIEAPIIQFSTYPNQSNTTGTINFLKSDGTTIMAVETENDRVNMNNTKIIGLGTGTAGTDAVNKSQMDTAIATAVGGVTTFAIARGGGSVTAETTGQITVSPPVGQATIMTVAGVTKATLNTSNLTMAVPIAMGSNKITGLTTATNNDEGTNLGQVNTAITTALTPYLTSASASATYATQTSVATAIAQAHQPFEIVRGGGSVTAETSGFITYNGAVGTGHNFKVATVNKAVLSDNTFETYTDVVNFKLPANGYMSVTDSGNVTRFVVDTQASQITARLPLSMNTTNKIINLATGTAGTDAVNKTQMDSAIATAVGGISAFSIARGGGSVTAETTGQITVSPPVGQATIMTVAGVTKATLNTSNLTMAVPIAMGNNKITGLATATNNDEAVNKLQMDTAISGAIGGITSYSIARGGGSVTAETTGQITINPPTGQGTNMSVNSVLKARLATDLFETYTDVVNFKLPVAGYMSVSDSGGITRFTVDANASRVTARWPLSMNTVNKITNLATGTDNTDAVNKLQMDTAITAGVTAGVANAYQITRASGTVAVGTSGEITNTAVSGQFVDTFVGSTRYIRTNANNGTGFSTNIKVPSMSFTTQPIYLSGPALGSNMDIYYASGNNIIAGGDALKTLQMDFATTSIKGKASGGIPFILYDYLGTTTKMNYDEANDKINVYTANGLAMNNKKITGLLTATANDEATNKGQMDTAITTALTPYLTSASASATYATQASVATAIAQTHQPFEITRGLGSVTAETTGQITINPTIGQGTVMSVNGVTKATLNTSNLTMTVPIAMGSNKISGLTTATNNDEATNLGQVNTAITTALTPYLTSATASSTYATQASVATAIAQTHQPFEITRGLGSVTAEITGQITINPTIGQGTVMAVNGVTKATLNTSNLTMTVPIAMGSNKISGLTTATNNDEATNKGQMDTAITTALTPYLTSATASSTYATQASVATAISQAHQPFEIVRGSGSVRAETTGQVTINPPTGQTTIVSVNGTTKATFSASNLTMAMPIAMGSNKITGLTTATNNDEATNKGQMDTAITTALSGYTPYQIARASAYVNCETGGDISYYVPGSGNKHKFYVQGTLGPVLQIEATSDLAVTTSHAQNAFYLWSNVFARGAQPNTTISYSSGTNITDNISTDLIRLRGNTEIQPTTTNGNLIIVKNQTGTTKFYITNTTAGLASPLTMTSNKITDLATGTVSTDAVNKGQMDTAIASAVSAVPTHNAYEIVRGTTSLSIDGGGVMTLAMPINTASFSITDPSNTGIAMSNWTTQSSIPYNINRCRTRVQSPTASTPYLQQWFNTTYGTSNTQTEILSSDSMNICVAGATDHINFRHSGSSLVARMASDYFDTHVTGGHRIYQHPGATLRYTIDTSTTDVVITPANDSLSIKGKTIFQPQADSTTAFRFRKAGVTTAFIDIDTTNNVLNMNTNKITGVATATTSDGAVNKGQMDTAIASAVGTPTSITQGGGTVSASAVGQITINPASGQATVMSVAGVTKATLNTSNLTMAVPIAMGSNKITDLTTATNNDEATNKGQMDTAISTALTPYLTSATASSTYATQTSVASAIANSHNPYELTRSGTVAYVRIVGDDVFHNSGPSGAIWDYYNGSPVRVTGSSGNEVYVADTAFRWRKGSSTGTEMYKISATTTAQTIVDVPNDSVLHRGKMIMRPHTSDGTMLQLQSLNGVNTLASFITSATDSNQYLTMFNHKITDVANPTTNQDVATKNYVDNVYRSSSRPLPNVVRNSDMNVNQKSSALPDGWIQYFQHANATSSNPTITDLPGYSNAIQVTTNVASSGLLHLYQAIEGQFLRLLNFGSSSGLGVTVSLWAKSTIANHKVPISFNLDPTAGECCSTFTLGTANVWTRVCVSIPNTTVYNLGGNTGTTRGGYITLNPSVPVGGSPNWATGVEGVWGGTSGTTRRMGLSDGSTNMMTSSGQTFWFTGIQADIGTGTIPFKPNSLSYQDQLNICRRYLYRIVSNSTQYLVGSVVRWDTVYTPCLIYFPVPMRISAVATFSSSTVLSIRLNNNGLVQSTGCFDDAWGGLEMRAITTTTSTANNGVYVYINTNGGWINLDADLA